MKRTLASVLVIAGIVLAFVAGTLYNGPSRTLENNMIQQIGNTYENYEGVRHIEIVRGDSETVVYKVTTDDGFTTTTYAPTNDYKIFG